MKKKILGLSLALVPMVSLAATNLTDIFDTLKGLFALAMPLLISLAVLFFIWALVQFIVKAGEEKAAARSQMIWGIVILFVIVSIWGLVGVFSETFGISGDSAPSVDFIPEVN